MYYKSQAGQDKFVLEFFKGKSGFFLDIGAHDGVEYSNSYCLEQVGWSGLCIEPNSNSFALLNKNRKCLKSNKAASSFKGRIKFTINDMSSSIDTGGRSEIGCDTIENILNEFNAPKIIDYISLDVEGHEIEALKGFPFHSRKFILMTVEHNLYLGSRNNKDDIFSILTSNGYVRIKENVEHLGLPFEDWYAHSDAAKLIF